jgi:hypothetical protein
MKKTVLGVVWLVAFGFGAAADEPKTEEVKKKALTSRAVSRPIPELPPMMSSCFPSSFILKSSTILGIDLDYRLAKPMPLDKLRSAGTGKGWSGRAMGILLGVVAKAVVNAAARNSDCRRRRCVHAG